MLDFLKKILGSGNEAKLKTLNKPVEAVMALEAEYRALTDEQLQAKTAEFRQRLQNGETEDDILPEAFATVREAADRVLGMRPYKVQVLGGVVGATGALRGNPLQAGQGALIAAHTSLSSDFSKVRSIKASPRHSTILVNEPMSKNQVYTAPEDFEFVLNFIKSHCPLVK